MVSGRQRTACHECWLGSKKKTWPTQWLRTGQHFEVMASKWFHFDVALTILGGEREPLKKLSSGRGAAQGSHTYTILWAGCGQEEPGSIMQVIIATGINNSPVISHIKAVFKNAN